MFYVADANAEVQGNTFISRYVIFSSNSSPGHYYRKSETHHQHSEENEYGIISEKHDTDGRQSSK